jgi:hypothetical protein
LPLLSSFKKYLIAICIILLLSSYAQAVTAFSGNYTARENPANVTATSGQVDYKTLSIMADLYRGLGNIALDINQSDFDKSKIDYASFKDLYDNNKDVLKRLFDSDADALDAINATDITVDDIRAYLDEARDYDEFYRLYQDSIANGDTANATAYAIKTKQEYKTLSAVYNDLRGSTYATMDRLDSSNQESINASLLQPFLDSTDRLMAQTAAEQKTIQAISGDYSLMLISSADEAAIGDTVTYNAILKRNSTDPVQGANIVLYANDQVVGSGITDLYGTCAIPYKIPEDIMQSNVSVYAEYTPAGQSILQAASDTLYLHVLDEPAILSSSVTPRQATFGDIVAVNGTLASEKGFPAPDLPVDVYLSGIRLGRAVTGEDGAYSFTFPVTEHIPGGSCDVYAVYLQASGFVFLSASSIPDTLDVSPQNTSITMVVSAARFTAGDLATINGTLMSESGLPVGDANFRAMLDGRQIGAGKTDINGAYTVKAMIPYDSISGNHSMYAVYVPANSSLSGSSSDRSIVQIDSITSAFTVNGMQAVLFLNDTLNVTGSLHTENGLPLRSQAVEIQASDSIGGTATTDEYGNFYYSRTVNGYDPAGIYEVSVYMLSPDGSMKPASATVGHVLILPVDKALAMMSSAIIVVLLIAIVLLAKAGMSISRLMDMATGRKRLQADMATGAPPVPEQQETIPVPSPSYELDSISALIASGGFAEAAVRMYAIARLMAANAGATVRGSDTHREFYRNMIASYPRLTGPLRPVVDTYERMSYGRGDSSVRDMQNAYDSLQSVQAAFNDETGTGKA